MEFGVLFVINPGMTLMPEWHVLKWDTLQEVSVFCKLIKNFSLSLSLMQVQLLIAQPTLMKDLDQFNLLVFNAMEQKLDYETVLTQYKTLALTHLMLVLHVLVSFIPWQSKSRVKF